MIDGGNSGAKMRQQVLKVLKKDSTIFPTVIEQANAKHYTLFSLLHHPAHTMTTMAQLPCRPVQAAPTPAAPHKKPYPLRRMRRPTQRQKIR